MILIFFEWKDPNFRYQYLDSINVLENAEKYHNSDCIFVYAKDYPYHAYPSFMEVSKFNSVTFIGDDHLDLIDDIEFDNAPNKSDNVDIEVSTSALNGLNLFFMKSNRFDDNSDTFDVKSDSDMISSPFFIVTLSSVVPFIVPPFMSQLLNV